MALIDRYKEAFDKIPGWFNFEFLYILQELNEIHKKSNVKGNLLEIGVYLGKSFIPLSFLLGEEESIIGVDCFDDQIFNTSNSGLPCSKSGVIENLKKVYLLEYKNIALKFNLIRSDSKILNPHIYLSFVNNKLPYRIIYIDGGHDKETCDIDLKNAANIICKDGFIIIDDYKNYYQEFKDSPIHGIGVTQAVDEFLLKNKNFKIYKYVYQKLIIFKEY
jgi:hypothetical protein